MRTELDSFKMWIKDIIQDKEDYHAYKHAISCASGVLETLPEIELQKIFSSLGMLYKVEDSLTKQDIYIVCHPGSFDSKTQFPATFPCQRVLGKFWIRLGDYNREFWPFDVVKNCSYQARSFYKFLGELFAHQYLLSNGQKSPFCYGDYGILSERIKNFLPLFN